MANIKQRYFNISYIMLRRNENSYVKLREEMYILNGLKGKGLSLGDRSWRICSGFRLKNQYSKMYLSTIFLMLWILKGAYRFMCYFIIYICASRCKAYIPVLCTRVPGKNIGYCVRDRFFGSYFLYPSIIPVQRLWPTMFFGEQKFLQLLLIFWMRRKREEHGEGEHGSVFSLHVQN